jgi:formamidopyrimidine-DNA glycosylase
MFEIPEYVTIAGQMARSLTGKRIAGGSLGNSAHKFVWYNRKPHEFERIVRGKTVGKAYTKGRWLFIPVEPGYILVFGECGGRILLHQSASELPDKYHLSLLFDDGTALSATTQMWGAMELYEKGKELQRKYISGMRTTPLEPGFTSSYFTRLVEESIKAGSKTVKAILTQNQLIPGLGNSIAQDIMFIARLHPRQPLEALNKEQIRKLHGAIVQTLKAAIKRGGRNDEFDLYGKPGRYARLMDSNAVGRPCPECGTKIKKIAYLGGAAYFCSKCQGMV